MKRYLTRNELVRFLLEHFADQGISDPIILYVGNNVELFNQLKESLQTDIEMVDSLMMAETILYNWDKKHNLLIIEVELSPLGLSKKEIDESMDGAITGIVFYKRLMMRFPVIFLATKETPRVFFERVSNEHSQAPASVCETVMVLEDQINSKK